MINILASLLPLKDGSFLDVGVNVGQTLVKVKSVDPMRTYIGFEPNSACVFYVDELIRQNQFQNCMIVPVGVFNKDEVRPLNFFNDSAVSSSSSMIMDGRSSDSIRSMKFVPVFTFETIEHSFAIEEVAFVKVDVEGAELEVLRSLAQLIHRCRPFLLIEVLPDYSGRISVRTDRQKKMERFLKDADYDIFRVEKTSHGAFRGLAEVNTFGSRSDVRLSDHLIVPRELAPLVQGRGLLSPNV